MPCNNLTKRKDEKDQRYDRKEREKTTAQGGTKRADVERALDAKSGKAEEEENDDDDDDEKKI